MYTHTILLAVQYITTTVLFLEILILFLRWKNTIHSYLFLACVATFISNVGYLFELKAGSEEAYLTALKISYVGRVWIVFAFFLFSAKMCGIRLSKWLVAFFTAVHLGIYLAVFTIGSNDLYYRDYSYVQDDVFPKFYHSNGVIHDLLIGLNLLFIAVTMTWVIRAFRRERNTVSRHRYFMLILAFSVQILSYGVHSLGVFPFSDYYDLTMPGELIGTIFMLIGILRFDLLGTREIARDFVIDRISEGIIALDKEGRVQYFNAPVTKLYPEFRTFFPSEEGEASTTFEEEEVTPDPGEGGVKIYHTPYDILAGISEAIEKGESIRIRDRIYSPEENDLLYRGENYGKLYTIVDDTEHYRYMDELQEQRDIADNANEAKSRFLANMSHEIRTPINAVLGMDEMILRESTEGNIRSYASDIMSAGRSLLSLINDILDLSKVEEGRMEIIPVQYELSNLVGDLVNMIRQRAVAKGLELTVLVDSHVPDFLVGDEIRIRQCVMNLLTNAVKYTEKGKVELRISFEKGEADHIDLTFTVKDTGIGMKKEDMDRLFTPYARIEEKRNHRIEGTGLGMSITRQLLELMGSHLDVESEYGKGSVFAFTIDQEVSKWEEFGDLDAKVKLSSDQTIEYRELFHAPEARILVVDDTEMNLTVIKSLLKKTGIRVDTATTGKEALQLAADRAYDVLLIDHMMPDMDGIETLRHMRESGRNLETPAVALTANAISGAREMYLEAGFTDYMSKPVSGERLERMFLTMLPKDKIRKPEEDMAEDASAEASGEENRNAEAISYAMDALGRIEGLDTETGRNNCGSEEGYLSVLKVFHQTAGSKADEIRQLYESEDFENYRIKVHALKSSARIIGAGQLSELARSLEDAGREGDLAYIRSHTDRLLEMYRELDAKLTLLDPKQETLPALNPGSMREAYQTMVELAGSMEYELMDDLLKELHGYRLTQEDGERIAEVEQKLSRLDWEGIVEIARKA